MVVKVSVEIFTYIDDQYTIADLDEYVKKNLPPFLLAPGYPTTPKIELEEVPYITPAEAQSHGRSQTQEVS